jgi:hypothetical protein
MASSAFVKVGTGVAAAVAVGVIAGYFVWGRDGTPTVPPAAAPVLPAEYAYLDSGRATTYLSQISNGLSSGEQRTLTHARELSGGADATLKLGISQTDTASVQETLTPTNTSQFALLLRRLEAARYGSGLPWLTKLDCFPRGGGEFAWKRLRELPEGAFVELHDCLIKFPDYGLVFPYFAQPVSVPLKLKIGTAKARLSILLPLTTASVTDPGLFIGHLVVVGKLLRTVATGSYRDPVAVARIEQSLVQLGPRLYKIPFPAASNANRPQRYLKGQIRRALLVPARGAIILPVAIYK